MKKNSFRLLFVYLFMLLFSPSQVNGQSLLESRIDELIGRMSTEEKISQLINSSFGETPSNTRLKIPGFVMDDGPHGVRFAVDRNGRSATSFPTGIAMAATFDEDVALKVGEAMGIEFWAFNRNVQLGPCIDLCRDPRGGRSAESGGEDPYLAGHIGKSLTIGIQKSPVVATVKHYMGESKQSNRHNMDVLATDRWLMDFSGYNFRTVVQEAGVLSVMGSYNKINGDKVCESSAMLSTNLRERWGFPFFVVSDWDAIWNSSKAIKAGTDVCMGSNKYAADLPGMVANGTVTIADLNKAVKHVLRTKILNGMLDNFPVGKATYAKTADIIATNKLAAHKSIILLKNSKKSDNTSILPLKKTVKVALIGPNATSENLNCFGSSETFPSYAVSVKKGLEAKIGAANISYAYGCDVNSSSKSGFDAALALAANADVVVFAGGLDASQEGEAYDIGADRKSGSIALPGQQQELINKLATVNPNIVVVIQSGGVCGLNSCLTNIKGLIYSFYAAQEAGTAIADVIFGDYNPAGRMPVSMVKRDADLPSWSEDNFRRFTDNLDGGYRWLDEKNISPEYAFGFGLSYTTYAYSNLVVSNATVAGQPVTVSVDVKNTGGIAGEEVVQLYLSCPSTQEVWMPKKQLRGFKRVALQANETKTVTFQLTADDFYYWDGSRYIAQSGNFTIRVGGASDNLPLTQSITLTEGNQKPDMKITQIYTMPRYPFEGQQVSFYALVKNQGNAINSVSSPFNIKYKIDGVEVANAENINVSIAPGQVQLIASTGVWKSNKTGETGLSAELNFTEGDLVEWDVNNNTFSTIFKIFDSEGDPEPPASRNHGSLIKKNAPLDVVIGHDWNPYFPAGAVVDFKAVTIDGRLWASIVGRGYELYTKPWSSQVRIYTPGLHEISQNNDPNFIEVDRTTNTTIVTAYPFTSINQIAVCQDDDNSFNGTEIWNYDVNTVNSGLAGDIQKPQLTSVEFGNQNGTIMPMSCRASDNSGDYFYLITDYANNYSFASLTDDFTITGLDPAKTYALSVVAVDFSGNESDGLTSTVDALNNNKITLSQRGNTIVINSLRQLSSVKLYSINGQQITTHISSNMLNTSNLAKGVYVLKVEDIQGEMNQFKFSVI